MSWYEGPIQIMNPSIPYQARIPGGAMPGKSVYVQGYVPHDSEGFSVNLKPHGGHNDDIAFHFNPRFNEPDVVCNTCVDGSWGSEERHPEPLQRGQAFEIKIKMKDYGFKASINGETICKYPHRVSLNDVDAVSIVGNVHVNVLRAEGGTVRSPEVPYIGPISGLTVPGRMVVIEGVAHPDAHRFSINLKSGQDGTMHDVAYHMAVRFDEGQIVCNTCTGGEWGAEERHDDFRFQPGEPFTIIILVDEDNIKTAINGAHHSEFGHRHPLHIIDALYIYGSCDINSIRFQ